MKPTPIVQRLPRPMGITQSMAEYHKNQDIALYSRIQEYFIQQWLINNQVVCGRSFTILELSQFLHCDPEKIREQMMEQVINTKIWDKDKQEALINSLIGQQVMWAVEDRMEVEGQVKKLKRSQGDGYTPFVTSEVNKALGLKLQTTSNLASILKTLQGSGSINIFNSQQNNDVNVGITLEQAIEIVSEENSKLPASKELRYIEQNHPVEEFPEVVASRQLKSSTDGLDLNRAELKQATDNYKGLLEKFDEEHHQIRREIELGIDTEEDDPDVK